METSLSFSLPTTKIEFFNKDGSAIIISPDQPGHIPVDDLCYQLLQMASNLNEEEYKSRLKSAQVTMKKHGFPISLQEQEATLGQFTTRLTEIQSTYIDETRAGVDPRYFEDEITAYPIGVLALLLQAEN